MASYLLCRLKLTHRVDNNAKILLKNIKAFSGMVIFLTVHWRLLMLLWVRTHQLRCSARGIQPILIFTGTWMNHLSRHSWEAGGKRLTHDVIKNKQWKIENFKLFANTGEYCLEAPYWLSTSMTTKSNAVMGTPLPHVENVCGGEDHYFSLQESSFVWPFPPR